MSVTARIKAFVGETYRAKWERERLENFTLREALKSANVEIRTLRQTVLQLEVKP